MGCAKGSPAGLVGGGCFTDPDGSDAAVRCPDAMPEAAGANGTKEGGAYGTGAVPDDWITDDSSTSIGSGTSWELAPVFTFRTDSSANSTEGGGTKGSRAHGAGAEPDVSNEAGGSPDGMADDADSSSTSIGSGIS